MTPQLRKPRLENYTSRIEIPGISEQEMPFVLRKELNVNEMKYFASDIISPVASVLLCTIAS
jgi:hypothetical protein